jgi:hypothetical protein
MNILEKYRDCPYFWKENFKLEFSYMVLAVFNESLKNEFKIAEEEDWYGTGGEENWDKIDILQDKCKALSKHGLRQLRKLTKIKKKRLKQILWSCAKLPTIKEMIKIGIALNRHFKLTWEKHNESICENERVSKMG